MRSFNELKTFFVMIFALIWLFACSAYPNRFKCGDAKGLSCKMLRDVDRQIDSGQIQETYKVKKRCSRGRCLTKSLSEDEELMQALPQNKATVHLREKEEAVAN